MKSVCSGAVGATAILLICLLSSVKANYTLEILMVSYSNPLHLAQEHINFRHGCCERDAATPCAACDNAFNVCVRETPTGETTGNCDFGGEKVSSRIEDNNDDLMFQIGENVGGLSNPIVLSGEMWPGRIEVVFNIYDVDMTANIDSTSDVVDNIFIYPDIEADPSTNSSFSEPVTFTGNANISQLELAFRLTCGRDFYGPDCTYCIPTNDSMGHYMCNISTGERVCLEGYKEPDCIDCLPAEGCDREGGYCNVPGECLCKRNYSYSGANCSDHPCDNQTCSEGYTCPKDSEGPYVCQCIKEDKCTCDVRCEDGQTCLNGTCTIIPSDPPPCEAECGENGRCINVEGEEDGCECEEGYSSTGGLCEAQVTGQGGESLLLIVVATVGGLIVILIVLVVVAICVLVTCGRKFKKNDDGVAPNPYETPFFKKWRGKGHSSNGVSERKFENPLYSERTNSPASPPLPPRPPEHPYATLEDLNSQYAHIPGDPVLEEKPTQPEFPESSSSLAVANPYDHIGPQSPSVGCDSIMEASPSPRIENPYLDPVPLSSSGEHEIPPPPPPPPQSSTSSQAMNSSTTLYAHIQ